MSGSIELKLAFCSLRFRDFLGNDHYLIHLRDQYKLMGQTDWLPIAGAGVRNALRSFLDSGDGKRKLQRFADFHAVVETRCLVDQMLHDVGAASGVARWLVVRRERESLSAKPRAAKLQDNEVNEQGDQRDEVAQDSDWFETRLVDDKGNVVPGVEFQVKLTDGRVVRGQSDGNGVIRFPNIVVGTCELRLTHRDQDSWSVQT